jgi:hypothetical protein
MRGSPRPATPGAEISGRAATASAELARQYLPPRPARAKRPAHRQLDLNQNLAIFGGLGMLCD